MALENPQHDCSFDFCERVLEHAPTPHVVVDPNGVVKYGNEQMRRLTGWSTDEGVGRNILDSVHPDDVGWIGESFLQLASADQVRMDGSDQPWAPVNFRLLDRLGSVIPVEVTGRSMLDDPVINGIVYEVRPAWEREIFQRVLEGLATGGSLESQFELILQLVSASAVDIDSAIVRFDADDRCDVVVAARPEPAELLADAAVADGLRAFRSAAPTPRYRPVIDIAGSLGKRLDRLGYRDAWHIDIPHLDERAPSERYRIIAFTKEHHVPARGVIERLGRSAELASVVLVRSRSERRLDDAAHHDHLTGLPNRLGLHRHVTAGFDAERPGVQRGATLLFIDLDGFKAVNDRHGHVVGDIVLRGVASRLRSVTGEDGLVARFGGDEFAVVLDTLDHDIVSAYADRVVGALGETVVVEGAEIAVSASIGVAALHTSAELAAAIARADQVMYEAKRSGGGWSSSGIAHANRISSGAGGLPR